jgi:lysozyme
MTSAQGIDVSAFQPVLTSADLNGLAFCFTKATDGPSETDPNFTLNWRVMKSAGIHRGAYHELRPGAAGPQAEHFLAVVKDAGLEPGDMLAVVASDYGGVTDAEVKTWCDQVQAASRTSPVLIYSDLSVARTLTSCTGYALWVAWPSSTAPSSVTPWKTWKFWQWSETDLDRDAYNGTAAELQAWLDAIAYPGK